MNEPSGTILCLYHATQRNDRVSRLLKSMGYNLEWINPVRSEALPTDLDRYLAVVVYGGEHSVNDPVAHVALEQDWINRWIALDKPYLGICLGAQFLAKSLGANVRRHHQGLLESGYTLIKPVSGKNRLIEQAMYVFQWHNEGFDIPPGTHRLAAGNRFANQAFTRAPHVIGLQFHPEVTPAVMLQWFHEGGHMLTSPGAHTAEAQLRDARVFESTIEGWTRTFLRQWASDAHLHVNTEKARASV